ncbi:MAG: hypothetical protein ACRD4F_03990 [Candidatus Angelobacter sp.]
MLAWSPPSYAQENYFITYTHNMEEPGNLEIATKSITGSLRQGSAFLGECHGAGVWHESLVDH